MIKRFHLPSIYYFDRNYNQTPYMLISFITVNEMTNDFKICCPKRENKKKLILILWQMLKTINY